MGFVSRYTLERKKALSSGEADGGIRKEDASLYRRFICSNGCFLNLLVVHGEFYRARGLYPFGGFPPRERECGGCAPLHPLRYRIGMTR